MNAALLDHVGHLLFQPGWCGLAYLKIRLKIMEFLGRHAIIDLVLNNNTWTVSNV
jgi:hypothetical protein